MPEEKQKPVKKVVDLTEDAELKDHDLDEVAGGGCGNTIENSTQTCASSCGGNKHM